MPNTDFDIYNGTHSCVEIDNNIDEVVAARGTKTTLSSRLGDIEAAIHNVEPTATEVTNARTNEAGTTFDDLGERLDSMDDDILNLQDNSNIMSLYDLSVETQNIDGTVVKDLIASAAYKDGGKTALASLKWGLMLLFSPVAFLAPSWLQRVS